jgi:RNA polymerase sigma-70 factor (ECF subfamily)
LKSSAAPSQSDVFETHRAYLIGVGYRMVGSLADAEDMVQEAYLRWHAAKETVSVQNPRAYLTRIVVRLCLDRMKSAQSRRETYVGPWLPEPVVGNSPFAQASPANALADDLSFALLLTLERLSPLERAAFLLHDVFDMDFQEIAAVLERSEASCRQLATRARQHVRSERPRFRASKEECERLTSAFARAAQSGDPAALTDLLTQDVLFLSDGGGRVPAAIRPISGRDNVTRLILGLTAKFNTFLPELRASPALVNGLAGLVFYDTSGPFQTLALEARDDGKIVAIYVVRNPDKLRHLQAHSCA